MALIEEIREYWNLRSSDFSDAVLYDIDSAKEKALDRIGMYLEGHEIHDILDVGCGPGFYAIMFGSKGYNVTGIDYSDQMIEEARRNVQSKNIKASFLVMDAQKLEFPDASFDFIVSRDVFWCLEQPKDAYSEILRVLRPGGLAIVSDGNYYLHLYNEQYAKSRGEVKEQKPAKPSNGGHYYFNKRNVDYSIIENLAFDMPLSHEERPKWDVATLCDLGCKDITIHVRNSRPFSNRDLVFSFDIIFTKGDKDGN